MDEKVTQEMRLLVSSMVELLNKGQNKDKLGVDQSEAEKEYNFKELSQ